MFVIDGIIRLVSGFPLNGIFTADDRLRLFTENKMLMLNNAGIRDFPFCIVDDSTTLIIFESKYFRLKT